MVFSKADAELFVPDGKPEERGLKSLQRKNSICMF